MNYALSSSFPNTLRTLNNAGVMNKSAKSADIRPATASVPKCANCIASETEKPRNVAQIITVVITIANPATLNVAFTQCS